MTATPQKLLKVEFPNEWRLLVRVLTSLVLLLFFPLRLGQTLFSSFGMVAHFSSYPTIFYSG